MNIFKNEQLYKQWKERTFDSFTKSYQIPLYGAGFTEELAERAVQENPVIMKAFAESNFDIAISVYNDFDLTLTNYLYSLGFTNIYLIVTITKGYEEAFYDQMQLNYKKSKFLDNIIAGKLPWTDIYFLVKEKDVLRFRNNKGAQIGMTHINAYLMNPPYDGNLHLNIFDTTRKATPNAVLVDLSPARWLQDPTAETNPKSDYNKFSELRQAITSYTLVKAADANNMFGITAHSDLAIYVVNPTETSCNINLTSEVMTKILLKLKTCPALDEDKKDGWRVRIPRVCAGKAGGSGKRKKWHGHGFMGPFYDGLRNGKPWYDFYQKNQYTKTTDTITKSIKFNSESEADNFCNSINSIVGGYISYHLIPGNAINEKTTMWLEDYTLPWTNQRLCEHFGLTGYVSDNTAIPGSDWAEILDFISKTNIYIPEAR